jgi:1-phosphofructokinase family hexose kinase
MIITVTANPLIEQVFRVESFVPGQRYRPAQGWMFATGKSLNVARGLRDLGEEAIAVVATAGQRGAIIEDMVRQEGIPLRTVPVAGENRVGFAVSDQHGTTTMYSQGPLLSDTDLARLVECVSSLLPARAIVLAGSTTHAGLFPLLCQLGIPVVLDFAEPCFMECVRMATVLIAKPNRFECGELLQEHDSIRAARRLGDAGAQWAVVTDGAAQAVFRTHGRSWLAIPPHVDDPQPVGCGDALCAGLLHAMDRPVEEAIAFSMACGVHNAMRPEIARLDRAQCELLAGEIQIEPLPGD